MTPRHVAVLLTLAWLALAPLTPVAAGSAHGGAAIALRYRFVVGQSTTYRLDVTITVTATGTLGNPLPEGRTFVGHITATGLLRETVLAVKPRGAAQLAFDVENTAITQTATGQARSTRTGDVVNKAVTIDADGLQRDVVAADDSVVMLQTVATLASRPVQLGTRWSTMTPDFILPFNNIPRPVPATMSNALLGYQPEHGVIVAIIGSTESGRYVDDSTYEGRPLHERAHNAVDGRLVFDVQRGQVVLSVAREDEELDLIGTDAHGKSATTHLRFIRTTSLQRL